MKKTKKKIIVLSIIPLVLLMTYGFLFYFNFFQSYITVNNNTISTSNKVSSSFKSCYNSNINFDDTPISQIAIDSITLNLLDKPISSENIYEKSLRYYIPINLVSSILDYAISENNNSMIIKNDSRTIILNSNTNCLINNIPYTMRGNLIEKDNKKLISLSDIEYLFNLTSIFNFEKKQISFLNKLSNSNIEDTTISTSGKAVLLRLEDFSAGYGTLDAENQLKYKCIGNFLKSNNIKFHIAWVPRFICPSQDIDNDLLNNNTLENVGFINTLDYLINCGAEVGLHGYSHQAGSDTSLNGIELSHKNNSSEADTRNVIENAIDTAEYLNIPCSFFESPHYKATTKQKDIIEEYFQFLYEPRNILIYNKIEKHNNNLYIPTPLGYVENLNTNTIEKYLKSPMPGQLASLFYHPALELDFVNINISGSTIDVDYRTNSPLYKIVKSIKDNSYVPIHITELNN